MNSVEYEGPVNTKENRVGNGFHESGCQRVKTSPGTGVVGMWIVTELMGMQKVIQADFRQKVLGLPQQNTRIYKRQRRTMPQRRNGLMARRPGGRGRGVAREAKGTGSQLGQVWWEPKASLDSAKEGSSAMLVRTSF